MVSKLIIGEIIFDTISRVLIPKQMCVDIYTLNRNWNKSIIKNFEVVF